MLIEVKETHPPKAANRSGTVVTLDGQKFDCWPNVLSRIRIGMRYEVETSTNDRGFTSITQVKPAGTATPAGFAREGAATATPAVAAPSGEAEFVGRVLHALILKGDVIYNTQQLEKATALLRGIWNNTSSDQGHYRQAAE
jgi:hypothetical protein